MLPLMRFRCSNGSSNASCGLWVVCGTARVGCVWHCRSGGCAWHCESGLRGTTGEGLRGTSGRGCVTLQEQGCMALQEWGLCGTTGERLRGTAGAGPCDTTGMGLCGSPGVGTVWNYRRGAAWLCKSGGCVALHERCCVALQERGCMALQEWGVAWHCRSGSCVALQEMVFVMPQERSCVALNVTPLSRHCQHLLLHTFMYVTRNSTLSAQHDSYGDLKRAVIKGNVNIRGAANRKNWRILDCVVTGVTQSSDSTCWAVPGGTPKLQMLLGYRARTVGYNSDQRSCQDTGESQNGGKPEK
jgi:hypothetical protein